MSKDKIIPVGVPAADPRPSLKAELTGSVARGPTPLELAQDRVARLKPHRPANAAELAEKIALRRAARGRLIGYNE